MAKRLHFFGFFCSMLVCGMLTAPNARAELITTTLTLNAPNAPTNVLALGLAGFQTTTNISGTLDLQFEVSQSGVVSTLTILDGSLAFSDFAFPILNVSGLAGFAGSNVANDIVTAGTFDAANHFVEINAGTTTGAVEEDFSVNPLRIDGSGTGSIATTSLGGGLFDFVLTLPIDAATDVSGASLTSAGNVVATGQFQLTAIPEPSTWLVLGIAGFAAYGRRRLRK